MDTVLGLSLTPTAAERVIVAGRDAGGSLLNCDTVETPAGGGASTAEAAARVVETVMRSQALSAENGRLIRTIGVTWADDAVAEAALVLEKLADAGLDYVVAVRSAQAAEAVEAGSALTVGHGAAVVAARNVAFPDAVVAGEPAAAPPAAAPAASLRYTGAVAAVVVGALSFVVSLSLAVSLQNTPERDFGPIERVATTTETVFDRAPQQMTPPAAPLGIDAPEPPADAEPDPELHVEPEPEADPEIEAGAEPPADAPGDESAPE
ncbi:hypothetical protein [Mycobacterium sp. 1274756.6]|uniref:hypothetical protein n=1 Tax=Mycobacterium sp. 1274756.6 TaxID=1834076 RepID=UPI0007FD25E6|nr:hypothetical protein [Mycobacterium sp. 1274756.6]OBJ69942.1 hypothetical protein A5643_11260 [Mycobacterium sp. 1274756.6]